MKPTKEQQELHDRIAAEDRRLNALLKPLPDAPALTDEQWSYIESKRSISGHGMITRDLIDSALARRPAAHFAAHPPEGWYATERWGKALAEACNAARMDAELFIADIHRRLSAPKKPTPDPARHGAAMTEAANIPDSLQQRYHYVCERIRHIESVRKEIGDIDEEHSRELTALRREKSYIERTGEVEAECKALRGKNERLSALVSDEEWGVCGVPAFQDIDAIHRRLADAIIASRTEAQNGM